MESIRALSSTSGTTDPVMRAQVPGRLVLVGARYDAAGERTAEDLVLVASLEAVDPA